MVGAVVVAVTIKTITTVAHLTIGINSNTEEVIINRWLARRGPLHNNRFLEIWMRMMTSSPLMTSTCERPKSLVINSLTLSI
jgi:hypothetical protein